MLIPSQYLDTPIVEDVAPVSTSYPLSCARKVIPSSSSFPPSGELPPCRSLLLQPTLALVATMTLAVAVTMTLALAATPLVAVAALVLML